MSDGVEWLIDAEGCVPDRLRDESALRAVAASLIETLGLHVLGAPLWHQFPWPGGWTGMYLLGESHLTCHTFPEHGRASWNLYCCRPRPAWNWERELTERLGAGRVSVRCVPRGTAASKRGQAPAIAVPESVPLGEHDAGGRREGNP
jgi:S-adenosylmethionine decarboxylase